MSPLLIYLVFALLFCPTIKAFKYVRISPVITPLHHVIDKTHSVTQLHSNPDDEPVSSSIVPRSPVMLPPSEYIGSSGMDLPAVVTIVLAQAALAIAAFVFELVTGFYIIPAAGFFDMSSNVLIQATLLSLPLIIGGFIFDALPWKFSKEVNRSTKIFSLRLLGISTPPVTAAALAAVVAIMAGISEEIVYRGYVFSLIQHFSNTNFAAVLSSVLFGAAHYPFFFGASSILETVLGGYFVFTFIYSGFNLAVPILVHTLYDFVTVFVTWQSASSEIQKKFAADIERVRLMPEKETVQFDSTCKSVFDIVDINKDGKIDKFEFLMAQRIYGRGPVIFGLPLLRGDIDYLFKKYDSDGDGRIDFNEFRSVVQEKLKTWPIKEGVV